MCRTCNGLSVLMDSLKAEGGALEKEHTTTCTGMYAIRFSRNRGNAIRMREGCNGHYVHR